MKIIKDYVKQGDTLVLAISGGPDSVFLLGKCIELKKEIPLDLVIAHVNHKLRGHESDKDAIFVKNIASKYNIPFELKILKKITSGNVEEKCRELRYKFFEEIRQKYNAKWILTAHHLNDNIETVFFNLIRGSSISGLKGIEAVSKKRHLLRPLLSIKKEDILTFLKKKKIDFREDMTNYDTNLSRNLLRHKIIPDLKKINPNLEETLSQNLENFSFLSKHLRSHAENWLKKNKKENYFEVDKFTKLNLSLQKNILAHIYKNLYGNTNKFNQNHLKQILKIIHENASNKQKEFGDNYIVRIKKDSKDNRVVEIKRKA